MVIRAKTINLFSGKTLTDCQNANSKLNMDEINSNALILKSLPRRIVLELTNACNINCVMCGRNAADFKKTSFNIEWFYALESLFDTVEEVTLMGWGEPTVHPQFVEMLEIINRHNARKYFCTNGMKLDVLTNAIFDNFVDVFAVSVDGAFPETNDTIRKGSKLTKINYDLRKIVQIKRANNLTYPHINYVFCAMKRNLFELPQVVEMAADIGIDEVKVVFLTTFNKEFLNESLYDCQTMVSDVFAKSTVRAEQLGILLKLPYVQGADPAGSKPHRDCYVAYRDFFLGSDGFVRPCMSTSDKFFSFDPKQNFFDTWNKTEYQQHRKIVNTSNMPENCRSCYQSSHCNWNNEKSYIQIGEDFAPNWE